MSRASDYKQLLKLAAWGLLAPVKKKGKGYKHMKFTVDKEFTTLAQLPQVREDCKEFKGRYTDNDLLSIFLDEIEEFDIPYGVSVLSANITAFPGGTDFDNQTCFHVELNCKGFEAFYVISYYCNLDFCIDTRDLAFTPGKKLYHVEKYVLQA